MKKYYIIIFYDPSDLFLCQNAIKPVEMPLHGKKLCKIKLYKLFKPL